MNIAVFSVPPSISIEVHFRTSFTVGQYGGYLAFWRDEAYAKRLTYGYAPGGMLLVRTLGLSEGKNLAGIAKKLLGTAEGLESRDWHGFPCTYRNVDDGLGPCINLLVEVQDDIVLFIEFGLDGADPSPWSPFSNESLLADISIIRVMDINRTEE